jgi:streptogrisin C
MNRNLARFLTAAVASTGAVFALSVSAAASPSVDSAPAPNGDGLSVQQTSKTTDRLGAELGSSYAGSYLIDDASTQVVATTDPAEVGAIRAAGAEPRVVDFTERQLKSDLARLDSVQRPSPEAVTGWGVDVRTNRLVVHALPGGVDNAKAFVARSGADVDRVTIEPTTDRPRPFADIVGGDAYYPGQYRCSVGFSVDGGFVTAGHCGTPGTPTLGSDQTDQGVVADSTFPGNDFGWVQVNSNWIPTPTVMDYAGGVVNVAGSAEAAVGAEVCRSGSTSGWHCGTIDALDQTVNYPEGTVSGLTQTSACAEPGDSGGSYISGDQAQGVCSGGSGDCTSGGTTFFQPVNPILETYGLTLVTG